MTAQRPVIAFFKDLDKGDLPLVGGKGANLGEMTQAGFPVPDGFAVTVVGYDQFLEENNLTKEISTFLKDLDVHQPERLADAAKGIQRSILRSRVPDSVAKEIIQAYKKLSGWGKKCLVAVRSSATAEDLPSASFAGQQATFLNVQGEANLVEATRQCWASLFTARAIFYREENKIDQQKVKISVIVQKMIQSEVSGVIFSIDPVTNEKDRIVIEAVWGLGELIVQGSVVPDRYLVQKQTFSILSKEVSDQAVQLVRRGDKTEEKEVPKSQRDLQKLTDQEIIQLAKIADGLQKHYYFPQDVEWAKEGKNLYIVQTRPVTTVDKKIKPVKGDQAASLKAAASPILTGIGASPGLGQGSVKVLQSAKEIGKIQPGDVLVAKMTSPDFVPAMKKAVAIVTDQGGLTSHAAIVSRELGIPCVVGAKEATTKLKEGNSVLVDGKEGQIFLGSKVKIEEDQKAKQKIEKEKFSSKKKLRTATKIYVNLAEPELAKKVSRLYLDGVGLLRAEFMIANIGLHPKQAIKEKKQERFIDQLTRGMSSFCKAFKGKPVVYRATDFKTNEYRQLEGGKAWEPEEPNPMLGFRGAYRYKAHPDVFNLELQAIKRVRKKYDNLWLMIPFVRSPQELADIRRIVASEGLFESSTFKFWMMVELPVNVILLRKFIDVGIDGVSIGSNDLTMLILGTDRDNAEVAQAFDEQSPAVLWALKKVIKICNQYRITSSICGQAPSVYDDLVEKLVRYGITSISVNPDAVGRVRHLVAEIEKKMIT